jgi:RNA-directed DNA polymerase
MQKCWRMNGKLRKWIGYYGLYSNKSLRRVLQHVDLRLIKWMKKKYRLGTRKAIAKLTRMKNENPKLFYHWEAGYC